MRDASEVAARPVPSRRVVAIVNPKAGSVGPNAIADLEAILAGEGVEGRVLDCADFSNLKDDLARAREERVDAAIVLGGDGTARAAAELSGEDGPPLIILPGGTMNMLPHALYGPLAWPDALKLALEQGEPQDLPGAKADDHLFFVAGIFGSPALAATAREALREGRLLAALTRARRAWRRAFSRRLRARADGSPLRRVEACAILAPLMAKTAGLERMEMAYLDPAGAFGAFRLGLGALTGAWRADPAAKLQTCLNADVYSRGVTPAILDGEPVSLGPHVRIESVRCAARVLAPPLGSAPG